MLNLVFTLIDVWLAKNSKGKTEDTRLSEDALEPKCYNAALNIQFNSEVDNRTIYEVVEALYIIIT